MSDIDNLLTQIERDACENSFYEFFISFWHEIVQEDLCDNWHIKYLCDELQKLSVNIIERKPKLYDLIINIPPGTTKSTIMTIMFPAWLWVKDPSLRIISNSYSSDLSTEHALKSRDIITSEKYQKLFPHIKLRRDSSGKSAYSNTLKGSRYTTSTGGTVVGKHAHVVINDDPVNPSQALSKLRREEANRHTGTLSSRKVDKSVAPTIVVMQRLHQNDVSGYLLKRKKNIKHICLPATLNENVKPLECKKFYKNRMLDERRLSSEVLSEAKMDLGTQGYTGQFMQNPVTEGGNIFKREWFPIITREQFEKIIAFNTPHFFLDTAYTEKKENDPSGIIATVKIGNNMYIFNGEKTWKKFPDLCRWLPVWCRTNRYTDNSTLRIEPKANGLSVIDSLQESTKLNVTKTPSPTQDKETRANSITAKTECGRVILVEGTWLEEFLDDVCAFPKAEHKEYVDVLVYAVNFHLKERPDTTELKKRLKNLV